MRSLGITYEHLLGIRFAVNVALATTVVWHSLRLVGDSSPLWAIASMVAASDPEVDKARRVFKGRVINVTIGCAVGLIAILVGGTGGGTLPLALAAAVLVSAYVVRVKDMWAQGPITVAIVVTAGVVHSSAASGVEQGLLRAAEVFYGGCVGLVVSWLMSSVWLIQRPADEQGPHEGRQ
jgi:uncharacterized membrane protein YccC